MSDDESARLAILNRAKAKPWTAQGIYVADGDGNLIARCPYDGNTTLHTAMVRARLIAEALNAMVKK